jgi:hypothetical protein
MAVKRPKMTHNDATVSSWPRLWGRAILANLERLNLLQRPWLLDFSTVRGVSFW